MTTELSDIQVLSLGLVKHGANRKPFFIVKSLERGEGQGVDGPPQGDGGADVCVCPDCGHEAAHEKGVPCAEISCPECGTEMRGGNAMAKEETIVQEEEVLEEVQKEDAEEQESLLDKIKKLVTKASVEEVKEESEEVVEPDLTGQIEALQKAQEDLKQELVKARQIAEEERETRIQNEYLEKAVTFAAVGAPKEQIAKVLRACDEMGEEVAKTIEDILKTADAAMRQSGVYEEVGTAEVEESGFMAGVEKMAKKLAEGDPKLSKAEAFAAAYKSMSAQDSEGAQEYVEERREATSRK